MTILGNVGSLYMMLLILLLVAGLVFSGHNLITYLISPSNTKTPPAKKEQSIFISNGWFKLAFASSIGILLIMGTMTVLSPSRGNSPYYNGMTYPEAIKMPMQNGIDVNSIYMNSIPIQNGTGISSTYVNGMPVYINSAPVQNGMVTAPLMNSAPMGMVTLDPGGLGSATGM